MIATFAALLLAHVLADFVFQPAWMVRHKANVFVLLLHVLIVFLYTTAALGGVWEVALVVTTAHLVIDAIKVWALPRNFAAFVADQGAHMATLLAAALYWPAAVKVGIWAPYLDIALAPVLISSGLIVTVLAGGYAIGHLMARFSTSATQTGLDEAGRLIGQLERALVFLLVMVGQPAGIGFLIAAKSILRFDAAKEDSEYVTIGTLASFAWALAASYGTLALLEIAAPAP